MKNLMIPCLLAALNLIPQASAQQSPQPGALVQAQAEPCVTLTPQNPSKGPAKSPSRLQALINKKLQAATGISVNDLTDGTRTANPKPVPCPTQAASAKTPLPTQPQTQKLFPDITLTLHCNAATPSPKDGGTHSTGLTLPDPHAFAVPKTGDVLVDAVVPELNPNVKTPCYAIRVDPQTGKSFAE